MTDSSKPDALPSGVREQLDELRARIQGVIRETRTFNERKQEAFCRVCPNLALMKLSASSESRATTAQNEAPFMGACLDCGRVWKDGKEVTREGQGEGTAAGPSEPYEALRLCATELFWLMKQVKAREGGSVERAYRAAVSSLASAPAAPSASLIEKLKAGLRLAKEATNGWACYAKRQVEHAEIARLHRDIDRLLVEAERVEQVSTRREGG